MKPAAFDYQRPDSIEATLSLLSASREQGRVIAGGQSLAPILNMRLAQPSVLIDLNDLDELRLIRDCGDSIEIGALVRHCEIEHSPLIRARCPFLTQCAATIGHYAIRQRGTIGGSLVQADPAAQFVLAITLLDAQIELLSTRGARWVEATTFITGAMSSCIAPDELLSRIRFPVQQPFERSAYQAFARRQGDYAIVSAGLILDAHNQRIERVRIALTGAAETPIRLPAIEAALFGATCSASAAKAIASDCAKSVAPAETDGIDSDYRRALVAALVERAFLTAMDLPQEQTV